MPMGVHGFAITMLKAHPYRAWHAVLVEELSLESVVENERWIWLLIEKQRKCSGLAV